MGHHRGEERILGILVLGSLGATEAGQAWLGVVQDPTPTVLLPRLSGIFLSVCSSSPEGSAASLGIVSKLGGESAP